jgi:hypothetical protein
MHKQLREPYAKTAVVAAGMPMAKALCDASGISSSY